MANNVFANGREISCKSGEGKSICAFPDVCMTPPENPATPPGVPVPYPNTGMASDMTSGSKEVKISGKEMMLKNKSYFKKSTGDEAGSAAKKGVVTSVNRGKVYFVAWSMDVQVEGENVVRHLDMTTHNHASPSTNTAPWTYADRMSMAPLGECEGEKEEVKKHCGDTSEKATCPNPSGIEKAEAERSALLDGLSKSQRRNRKRSATYKRAKAKVKKAYDRFAKTVQNDPCQRALRCFMSPYKPSKCCPKQTPDHIIDAASFLVPEKGRPRAQRKKIEGWGNYDVNKAPCVCAEGPNQTTATHGQLHLRRGVVAMAERDPKRMWSRQKAARAGAKAVQKTFATSECTADCLEAQINHYHDHAKDKGPEKDIKGSYSMTSNESDRVRARAEMLPMNFSG